MDYDFSSVSADTVESIEKKLNKIKINMIDDIHHFIRVLNDRDVIDNLNEINTVINDLMSDEIRKSLIAFTGCMNRIQTSIKNYF